MLEIISNPVTLSVIVMCVLCLLKLNVILSLLVAAMVAGLTAGLDLDVIMGFVIDGLNGNGTNALAYLLLGTFAAALTDTGLATLLGKWIASVVKERKWVLLITFLLCACISGTLVPIHIAYIPILYPPLLHMMNKMKMDRRQAACVQHLAQLVRLFFHFAEASVSRHNGLQSLLFAQELGSRLRVRIKIRLPGALGHFHISFFDKSQFFQHKFLSCAPFCGANFYFYHHTLFFPRRQIFARLLHILALIFEEGKRRNEEASGGLNSNFACIFLRAERRGGQHKGGSRLYRPDV